MREVYLFNLDFTVWVQVECGGGIVAEIMGGEFEKGLQAIFVAMGRQRKS